ncbi:MAG: putative heme transporter [Solirubrobacterales bacterium]|nr:putative heme transporter [Solirubrobacterales bacterium]
MIARTARADRLPEPLPSQLSATRFRRAALFAVAIAALLGALVVLLPSLSALRTSFSGAEPDWIALAICAELLSCLSYVLVFRSVFCHRMDWRTATELGLAEQAANSLLSVGGAGGLALGAWILRQQSVPKEQIGRLTVTFFLITSLANVGFLSICGIALASGLASGPDDRLLLGGIPAAAGMVAIVLALAIGAFAGRLTTATDRASVKAGLAAIDEGVGGAIEQLRSPPALAGSTGYMLFDIAVLAICFRAFGLPTPPLDALALAYIIGQLGGLIPLPGGAGGLDLGLIGALVLYGSTAADATVAVLAYRAIYLIVPAGNGAACAGLATTTTCPPRRPVRLLCSYRGPSPLSGTRRASGGQALLAALNRLGQPGDPDVIEMDARSHSDQA